MPINKLLAGAVKIFLLSQVSEVKQLDIRVSGKSRQILKGYIPEVFINTQKAIYQQLHFSTLEVQGSNIKINLGQVKSQKALQLLEPILVDLKALILATDAIQSLTAPLLQDGLTDIAQKLLAGYPEYLVNKENYHWEQISLTNEAIAFSGTLQKSDRTIPLKLATQVKLANNHTLILLAQEITTDRSLPISEEPITFDLGEQTSITELKITPEQLALTGKITIYP